MGTYYSASIWVRASQVDRRAATYPRHNTTGQRQHTNPRAQLRRWKAPESNGLIWCYTKQPGPGRRIHRQTIASATVLRRIWTEDEEHRLNREVEQPAASALKQLTETLQPSLRRHERQAVAMSIGFQY